MLDDDTRALFALGNSARAARAWNNKTRTCAFATTTAVFKTRAFCAACELAAYCVNVFSNIMRGRAKRDMAGGA